MSGTWVTCSGGVTSRVDKAPIDSLCTYHGGAVLKNGYIFVAVADFLGEVRINSPQQVATESGHL